MIIVFGSISLDIQFEMDALPGADENAFAKGYHIAPGGRGASQALAAARSGAKVALVGCVGDDAFSAPILTKLRGEGIMISGVAKIDESTGTALSIREDTGKPRTIIALGANQNASAEQIPDSIFNESTMLLVQNEIAAGENAILLERAKAHGAATMMNLAPSIEMKQKTLDHLDYLVVNNKQAVELAKKIGLGEGEDTIKMAQGLAQQGDLNCIVTMGARGCVAVTKDGKGWTMEALPIEKVVDHSGAEDAYCGTLAAALQAGLPLPRAMKRASIAGSLTCARKGAQRAFPYLADIEEQLNTLEDPQAVAL